MSKSEFKKVKDHKIIAKKTLFSQLWPADKISTALVLVYMPSEKIQQEIVYKLLEGLLVLNIKVIVFSDDEHEADNTGKIIWEKRLNDSEYQDAADMAILLDDEHSLMEVIMEKGIVIIGHEKSPLLQNYNLNSETGNSFTYSDLSSAWSVFSALVRALETYKFPYDWDHILRGLIK